MKNTARGQRGITLIVVLIMIGALSLMAAMAFRMSTSNVRIVGNAQVRAEVQRAADSALEQTISNRLFITDTATVAAAGVDIDIDGDGTTDYKAALSPAPACYRLRQVKKVELNYAVADDVRCMTEPKNSGVLGDGGSADAATASNANSVYSNCFDSEWRLRAEVTDARTGAVFASNQGVSTRISIDDANTACP